MRQTILMIAMMLTWALPCSFSAGASSIKGRVVDAEDGKAILFADVIARGADGTVKASCITGEEGFLLEGIESQTVTVEVMFIGYRTYNSDVVNLKQGETYDLGTISLEKDAESLKGVTVTSDKNQIVYRLDRQSISASSAVTAAGGTALDILANTPSIQVNSDGDLTFRGSSNYLVYGDG
ncbi:MAG: carboxypeptidase regulatory-like domain-containing protein [Bacteroidales bacterium]|nr:carboxypeptidase regulatory-like domain-containing protein [Candidatus Cryptobacteroides faecihippi]